jgi:predicted RNA methylase
MPISHSPVTTGVHSARIVRQTTRDEPRRFAPSDRERLPLRLQQRLQVNVSQFERAMALLVDRERPESLRQFDQIPMKPRDHVRQVKVMMPYLAGQSVAFMGDSDGTSMLLGLLTTHLRQPPSRMLLLDFDERLLDVARRLAEEFGFDHMLETQLYNVFDRLPAHLVGQFDWFYANPPYGSHNQGASARLFITRGCELTRSGGRGGIILPHDDERDWTRAAMLRTQRFLCEHGWAMSEKVNGLHRYRLDDDRRLTSSLMLVEQIADSVTQPMPYAERRVAFDEIELFYGRTVAPPYPHFISADGSFDCDWDSAQIGREE